MEVAFFLLLLVFLLYSNLLSSSYILEFAFSAFSNLCLNFSIYFKFYSINALPFIVELLFCEYVLVLDFVLYDFVFASLKCLIFDNNFLILAANS